MRSFPSTVTNNGALYARKETKGRHFNQSGEVMSPETVSAVLFFQGDDSRLDNFRGNGHSKKGLICDCAEDPTYAIRNSFLAGYKLFHVKSVSRRPQCFQKNENVKNNNRSEMCALESNGALIFRLKVVDPKRIS